MIGACDSLSFAGFGIVQPQLFRQSHARLPDIPLAKLVEQVRW